MFDFVRKTRAPRRRIPVPDDEKRSFLSRVHPRVLFAVVLLIVSMAIGFFLLKQRASWNGGDQIGFVVVFGDDSQVARPLAIVVANGADHKAIALSLPGTLEIEALHGYGSYKSSSLYGLAALEKLPVSFVAQTLSMQFGIDAENVIWLPGNDINLSSQRLSNAFFSSTMLRTGSTFGLIDRYRLWRFFSGLRKDQFSVVDLASSSVLKPSEQPGAPGQATADPTLQQLDPIKLDPLVFQLFSDDALRKENTAVAIVNTTGELRLGTRIARALSNMGVNVISVTSTNDQLQNSQLLGAEDNSTKTRAATLIQHVLLLPNTQLKKDPAQTLENRSDLVLMLGKDIAQMYAGK
ncbi:MAG TPA: LytR C-terminal domain-containing protein [Candidatus Saccharimonadia bacterium]|nr:LytR C-terminal domain-containing protein [Candidatus Saccharimonadia bacterium]